MKLGSLFRETFKQTKKHFFNFFLIYIVYSLLVGLLNIFELNIIAYLISIVFTPLMAIEFYLSIKEDRKASFSGIIKLFRKNILFTSLLEALLIILWSFLFIVPGIIKSISYQRAIFLAHKDPELKANIAIKESEKQMYGKKGTYFLANLIFSLPNIISGFALLILLILAIVASKEINPSNIYELFAAGIEVGLLITILVSFIIGIILGLVALIFRAVFNIELDNIEALDIEI